MGTVALAAVALQLLLTVALQPWQSAAWLAPFDRIGAIPMWQFFAFGDPGAELRLMIRDGRGDVALADWREVPVWPARRLRDAVWTPHGLAATRLATLLDVLARRAGRDPGFDPALSSAHGKLLGLVLAGPPPAPGATARQFAVVRHRVTGPGETLFTSRFHPLP